MPLDGYGFLADPPVEIDSYLYPIEEVESDTVRVLREALRLTERGWCRKAYAKCGWLPVSTNFPIATRYCAKGALYRAAYNLNLNRVGAEIAFIAVIGDIKIEEWNDDLPNRAPVIAAFQQAITESVDRHR